jgi:hypothetical protein
MHPEMISIIEETTGILLLHSIPHEHPDPCDLRGDAPPLQELTDFEVWIEVVPQSLSETVKLTQTEDIEQDYLRGNELLLDPPFIAEISIGSLRGYHITWSVEGCGRYDYYFPLSDSSTLYIVRLIITELTPNVTNYQEYLALPGIIPPEEEEALFLQILSTFEVVE